MKARLLLALLILPVAAMAQQVPQPESAHQLFLKHKAKAEQGDAVAQNHLGRCYDTGSGVAKDAVEAVRWDRKAAAQSHAEAQFNLGAPYASGWGVAKDEVECVATIKTFQ